ncbi:MAG: hypothetical protein MW689_000386 [Thermodesulfobacteria bacterium]|nr:hypothetical protein [Thermodesulfobacteriota bacterium]MCU4138597.1 hypothetical protein [Thermodesulfobacteriota bacterium]
MVAEQNRKVYFRGTWFCRNRKGEERNSRQTLHHKDRNLELAGKCGYKNKKGRENPPSCIEPIQDRPSIPPFPVSPSTKWPLPQGI